MKDLMILFVPLRKHKKTSLQLGLIVGGVWHGK